MHQIAYVVCQLGIVGLSGLGLITPVWAIPVESVGDRPIAQVIPEPIIPADTLDDSGLQQLSTPLNPEEMESAPRADEADTASEQDPLCADTTSEAPPIQAIRIQNLETLEVFQDQLRNKLALVLQECEGAPASQANIDSIAHALTQRYLNDGYLSTRVMPASETPTLGGTVEFVVAEGRLGEIEITNVDDLRIHFQYLEQRIRLGAPSDRPLQAQALEDQLRLLNTDPLFENVEASLGASGTPRQSRLQVRVVEALPLEANLSLDNYSPASVGSERLTASLLYRNPTGFGDSLSLSHSRTIQAGAYSWDIHYQVPLNPMNGMLSLGATIDETEIVQDPFSELDIQGESERYAIDFNQPIIRTPVEELAFSIGFDFKDGQTFMFNDIPTPFGLGPDEEGVSRTSVIRLGQNYLHRDSRGAVALRSRFSFGLDWLDATDNEGSLPDSQFVSWLGQVQRVQRLSDDHFVILQVDLQLTPDSLLPSEQFVIGGGQSVRAYRQNARSGDNGFRLILEDRIAIDRNEAGIPIFQIAPFLDMGSVWNHPDNPNELPRQNFLLSVGAAVIWDPLPGVNLQASYGFPFVDLADRQDNLQDDGFFFSIGINRRF